METERTCKWCMRYLENQKDKRSHYCNDECREYARNYRLGRGHTRGPK